MTFGFDDRFAMFDITPVENQFILDYLPSANGDYIKVYLYGLMFCYHPDGGMTLERMCHDLGMTEEQVMAAFRYWERNGLVFRVSDHPPEWKYCNLKQKSMSADLLKDSGYETFTKDIYDVFGGERRLHGAEIAACYEWQEDLRLPTEVIIMLLKHMASVKGKNFSIRTAGTLAARMAEENIHSIEEAEVFLSRDKSLYDGTRKVLRRLGKYNNPSEGQLAMYRKWVKEWHFTPDAIEDACDRTAGGDPSMAYLDGVLNNLRKEKKGPSDRMDRNDLRIAEEKAARLRGILRTLGRGELNAGSLALYERMSELYPDEVIRIAAEECSRTGGGTDELMDLLSAWKKKGLESTEEIKSYVSAFHQRNALLKAIRNVWGGEAPLLSEANRKYADRWETEMGFSREMILLAAESASDARNPMQYMNKILQEWSRSGIRTPEAVQADRSKRQADKGQKSEIGGKIGKSVPAQDYRQRDYSEIQNNAIERFVRQSGGKPDAG